MPSLSALHLVGPRDLSQLKTPQEPPVSVTQDPLSSFVKSASVKLVFTEAFLAVEDVPILLSIPSSSLRSFALRSCSSLTCCALTEVSDAVAKAMKPNAMTLRRHGMFDISVQISLLSTRATCSGGDIRAFSLN